jgi:hypothetical protein
VLLFQPKLHQYDFAPTDKLVKHTLIFNHILEICKTYFWANIIQNVGHVVALLYALLKARKPIAEQTSLLFAATVCRVKLSKLELNFARDRPLLVY